MKKFRLFLLTLGLTGHCFAQSGALQKAAQLDELMEAYDRLNQFNGTVLVGKGDSIIYQRAFGWKDAGKGAKNNDSTLFRIYSVTKTFTSTLVFKLIEQGKLSLDDRLSKFYPAFPEGASISIRHLLTHTSGIYDYVRGNDMKDVTESSFIRFLSSKQLGFPPGKGWDYSNSNYWLLGFIIAKTTGLAYEDAVRKFIFEPCGMNNSGFDFKTLQHKNKATGYDIFSEEEKKESQDIDPPGPYAAGAVYSTTADLYKYYKAHESFKLISRSSLEKAWMPDSLNQHYGFGWQIKEFDSKRVIYHGGGGPGFRSNFSFIPQDSLCVILLTNNGNTNLDALTKLILCVVYGKPYKKPFEVKVGEDRFAAYKGFFAFDSSFCVEIKMAGKRLMAKPINQAETMLFAEKDNLFYGIDADAYLEFVMNKDGGCDEVVLRSGDGSRKKTGKRYTPVWGILGSATTIGWDGVKDLALSEKPNSKGVWTITDIVLKEGVFKFRFNNDWDMNYGKGKSQGELELNGKDIHVEAGVYDLELDLSDQQRPRYLISKKK